MTKPNGKIYNAFQAFAIISFVVVFGFAAVWIINHQDQPVFEPGQPVGAVSGAQVGATLTPFQPARPTDTPDPTKEPTVTHIPPTAPRDTAQVKVVVREVTQVVKVQVTQIIPVTPTPQPTGTPDQAAFNQKIANSDALRYQFILWGVTLVSSVTFLALFIRAGWVTVQHWRQDKLDNASGQTEAEEFKGDYWHNLYPDYRQRVWYLRKEESATVGDIVGDLWPQNKSRGGSHYIKVVETLKVYDPLGKYGPTTPPPAGDDGPNETTQSR